MKMWVVAAWVLFAIVHTGESVAVAALEDHNAGLCYQHDDKMDGVVGMCLLVHPEHIQRNNHTTILTIALNHTTVLKAGMNSFRLWVETGQKRYRFNETLEKEAWNSLCVGHQLEDNSTQVWAVLRGNLLIKSSSEDLASEREDPMICFGKPRPISSQNAFTGFVANASLLFNIPLEPPSCQSLVAEREDNYNSTLPFNASLWNLHGPVTITQIQEHSQCSLSYHTVVLNRLLNYHDFHRLCRSLGGRPPNMQDLENGVLEVEVCERSRAYELWGKEEEETVISDAVTAICPVLLPANSTLGWRSCLSEVTCSLCRVPVQTIYTLYGDVEKFDRHYLLKLIPEGGFYFDGDATSTISKDEESWVLHSRLHQEQWRLRNGSWPLGRRLWDSSHDSVVLTLASCNILQFSSNDGVCLPRSRRCDEFQDLDDNSDEQECHERLLVKQKTYNSIKNPYHDRSGNGSLWIAARMEYVSKISTEKGIAEISFGMKTEWQDPRLKFVDVKMSRTLFPCTEIWTPRINVIAGYRSGPDMEKKVLMDSCYIKQERKQPEHRDLSDPYMGMVTRWENVNLTFEEFFGVSFPCQLKVHRYPFGRYQCNASLYVVGNFQEMNWKPYKKTQSTTIHLRYNGDPDLLDYFLENITIDVRKTYVTLTLHLSGRYEYHLLNSFCPSALMFIISYSTLFFPINDFNERIMGSLTSLLVLAGLFSQASESYIKTPYFKLIDVWYAVLIMLCFGVVVTNSLINKLRTKIYLAKVYPLKKDYMTEDREDKRARVCDKISKLVFMGIFITFLLVFVMLGADIL